MILLLPPLHFVVILVEIRLSLCRMFMFMYAFEMHSNGLNRLKSEQRGNIDFHPELSELRIIMQR